MTDSRLQVAIKRYQKAIEQLQTPIDAATDPKHLVEDAQKRLTEQENGK